MFDKISIIGAGGVVGATLKKYFEKNHHVLAHDPPKGMYDDYNDGDIIFVAVPTPYVSDRFDLSLVEEILEKIKDDKIVIIKSTVLPGTTERLQSRFSNLRLGFCPEFLTEATADSDMEFPDRQIFGYTDYTYSASKDIMRTLPRAPYERIIPATEAETIKFATNSYFAMKVVFFNEIYDYCVKLGIDYDKVCDGTCADKRIGNSHSVIFHNGGRGAGNKCLPKDLSAFCDETKSKLLEKVKEINDNLLKNSGKSDFGGMYNLK